MNTNECPRCYHNTELLVIESQYWLEVCYDCIVELSELKYSREPELNPDR